LPIIGSRRDQLRGGETCGLGDWLAGCGGDAEDFAVEVKRPVAAVYAPLLAADVGEARIAFPGVSFERTRPSDTEILYTVPGTGSFPATVRFKLEPKNGGETTLIHTFVKVPEVHAVIDGREKVLSEWKIERQLQNLLKSTGRSLEMGSSAQSESRRLASLLIAIAIATDENHLARALDFKNDPTKLATLLLAFEGAGSERAPNVDGRDIRGADPDAAQQRAEIAQARAEWKQEEALNSAAKPTSDLDRYDN
jgi:hypothetical protein